jgi:hypothetical protein
MVLSLQLSLHPRTVIVNLRKLRVVLVLVSAALCAGLLASCGDAEDSSSGSASSVLHETLAATSRLDSGRLTGRLRLDPDGLISLGGPIVMSASGPFAAPGAGTGPRFDMKLAAAIGGGSFEARARSTGKRAYLRLADRDYLLGAFGSRAKKTAKRSAARGVLGSLGLNPASWVSKPQSKGTATIAGVQTVHIAGDLDVERLLADVAKLLGGSGAGEGLLTPQLRAQIADAVKSAKVELWSGAQDRVLRQLTAFVDFRFPQGRPTPIMGLDGGRMNLRLRLDDVNATSFEVAAPENARPLSQLIGDAGLDGLLSGLGASFGGSGGRGDGGAAFLRCITAAGGDSAKVMSCASKRSTP